MFNSQQQFSTWLTDKLDEVQRLSFNKLDSTNQEKLYQIYQAGSKIEGNYQLENVLLKIGKTVFELMQLTKTFDWVGEDKKNWVMANAMAFSYLLDNGVDGTEDNIHKDIKGFEFLAQEPNALQEKLVRNQVDQALEEVYSMTKKIEMEQKDFTQALESLKSQLQ